MKKFIFLFLRGLKFFYTNISINIASILTVTTILFVFHIFLTISLSVNDFFTGMGNIQSIRLYLNTENKKEINDFMKKLNNLESIESTTYFSQEDTMKYINKSTSNISYLQNIPKEFYPHFIEAKIKSEYSNFSSVEKLEETLKSFNIVDVASYGEKWIVNFSSLNYGFKIFLSILTILLALALSTILYNTIKINLYRYKDEIKIYSLVGASRTFIITPIVIAVIIESLISYLLSATGSYLTFLTLNMKILHPIDIYFIKLPELFTLALIFGVLILISVFSGIISVKTFLNNMGAINE